MRGEDTSGYAGKHPPGARPDSLVASAVKKRAEGGEISCGAAFEIASELGMAPSEVGRAIDLMGIRLIRCQLGLFGHRPEKKILRPAETVPPDLERAIRQRLAKGGLPCAGAWAIAERLKVEKMVVSSAAEAMKIKIRPCQLGAF